MPLYTFKDKQIVEVTSTNFAAERIREREDIQAALRDKIDIISPNTLIISEEFSEWSEENKRIDLLGVDKQANNDILRTADGLEIAVCTEWGKGKAGSPGNIDNFIGCAKKLGYQIEAE